LVLSGTAIAQDKNRLFTPEELKADVAYYYETLYSKHPNPYHYYPLSEFEDVKNRVCAQLNKPLTKEQFSRIILELNSCIDRHSQIQARYSHLTKADIDSINKLKLFPRIKIEDGKLFFRNEHQQDEIVEINGMAVSDILSDMKKGYNWRLPYANTVNYNQIRMLFLGEICVTYKLKPPFRVKFAGSNKIHTVEGVTYPRTDREDYAYKIYPDNSIAIFYITTFNGSKKEQFEKACNEFIQAVNEQKIKYIFYDLSSNLGGNHFGLSALDVIRHDDIYFKLTKICREKAAVIRKFRVNDLLLPPNHDINIPKDRKLFVLQGIGTESCGNYFCRIVAENKLGVLVGQPTGEPTVAFTWTHSYEMPNTKISFNIAAEFWDFSDYFKSETLNPDMYWDVSPLDFTEKELMEIIKSYGKNE
ncbi:MAG: S41 family peptidase, partial [Dysgonamonadaceae bacterium]|nr:S41 family peptidase [Dysgonamonadaceae bacterium]